MKNSMKGILLQASKIFLLFAFLCGIVYTGIVTGIAQVIFPSQANGSVIEVNGKKYGSILLGQQYTDDSHMWGRIMNIDVSTFQNEQGEMLLYASPSNLSPTSEEYKELIDKRVEKIKASNPEMKDTKIPEDLVTCSGSGLDPHISPAAANYQVERIVKAKGISKDEVTNIIKKCTNTRLLGIFGEETVNVLEVNLMLDGILK